MVDWRHLAKLGVRPVESLLGLRLRAVDPLKLGAAQLARQPLRPLALGVHAGEELGRLLEPPLQLRLVSFVHPLLKGLRSERIAPLDQLRSRQSLDLGDFVGGELGAVAL